MKSKKLVIQHIPGNGAWTYQLIIPNTKDIKGKWGDLKVSGTIDGYEIKHKNLGPMKNADKKMALNSEIRKAINKSGGDAVTVTLFLEKANEIDDTNEILACLKDADVLGIFDKINKNEQKQMLADIMDAATEDQQAEKILKAIKNLEKLRAQTLTANIGFGWPAIYAQLLFGIWLQLQPKNNARPV